MLSDQGQDFRSAFRGADENSDFRFIGEQRVFVAKLRARCSFYAHWRNQRLRTGAALRAGF